MTVFGVFLVCIFPYSDCIRIHSKCRKIRTRKTTNTDTYEVSVSIMGKVGTKGLQILACSSHLQMFWKIVVFKILENSHKKHGWVLWPIKLYLYLKELHQRYLWDFRFSEWLFNILPLASCLIFGNIFAWRLFVIPKRLTNQPNIYLFKVAIETLEKGVKYVPN